MFGGVWVCVLGRVFECGIITYVIRRCAWTADQTHVETAGSLSQTRKMEVRVDYPTYPRRAGEKTGRTVVVLPPQELLEELLGFLSRDIVEVREGRGKGKGVEYTTNTRHTRGDPDRAWKQSDRGNPASRMQFGVAKSWS